MTAAFDHAWVFLKALPEQQMFVERTPRSTVSGAEDFDEDYGHLPEIDRFGARSLGTVHPAILGMLQRRTDDYHQHYGMSPNLNSDMGAEEGIRFNEEYEEEYPNQFAHLPIGMSIARSPSHNRHFYDMRQNR